MYCPRCQLRCPSNSTYCPECDFPIKPDTPEEVLDDAQDGLLVPLLEGASEDTQAARDKLESAGIEAWLTKRRHKNTGHPDLNRVEVRAEDEDAAREALMDSGA